MSHTPITSPARVRVGYMKCEDGSATILSLFFVLIFIVMGGLAIDFAKVMSERTQLQVAADTAAHAALYSREFKSESESNAIALSTIDRMLPDFTFGTNAINTTDVSFGVWDKDTLTFTSDPNSRTAVRVNAQMTEARSNASRNLLLRIIGQDTFDVSTQSVYTTYYPPCFNEGFVADKPVEIQSNNTYTDGFCIHSNDYVSINLNNLFESGTVVSMPNLDNLDLPSSGFEQNDGLQAALRTGEYRMRLLNQLPQMIQSYYAGSPKYAGMAGITSNTVPIVLSEPVTSSNENSGKTNGSTTTTMV
ncbi:MAG TPA: Tad domain-containing protein, partial [Paracoccaceae bacterium]|nr:Tad domain-containing protein [Paracoccaceae bacterium]